MVSILLHLSNGGMIGDGFLVVTTTEFPHGNAFRPDQLSHGLTSRGDLSDPTIEKIFSDNVQRLLSQPRASNLKTR
jgi:hypothetical protein